MKQTDGDFTEEQRIELNTVRHQFIIPLFNQTKHFLVHPPAPFSPLVAQHNILIFVLMINKNVREHLYYCKWCMTAILAAYNPLIFSSLPYLHVSAATDRLLQPDQVLRHGEVWVRRFWSVWALSEGLTQGKSRPSLTLTFPTYHILIES